ncbi:MAG: hypothetical protein ACJ77E_12875 [Gaiellaceae bacterium]
MNDDFEELELEMTTQRIGAVAIPSPSADGAPAAGGAARLRPAAMLYLACVVALAVGGGLLGVRLLQSGAPAVTAAHVGPSGVGTPTRTGFGYVEVESVQQILGLTPKQLAGMTHGIQSLVKADQIRVQLVLGLRNTSGTAKDYNPAQLVLRVGPARGKTKTYESVTASVRAGRLAGRSSMETTVGFVIPRFNPKGSRISLELREHGRAPVNLDLGPVRPGGSISAVRAALAQGHVH